MIRSLDGAPDGGKIVNPCLVIYPSVRSGTDSNARVVSEFATGGPTRLVSSLPPLEPTVVARSPTIMRFHESVMLLPTGRLGPRWDVTRISRLDLLFTDSFMAGFMEFTTWTIVYDETRFAHFWNDVEVEFLFHCVGEV